MERLPWNQVDLSMFDRLQKVRRGRGNKGGRKLDYLDTFATFDVETTRVELSGQPHSVVYVWMFYMKAFDLMITGRTVEEFAEFLTALKPHLREYLVIYVHNLSYEFQFLSGIYDFANDEVFAVKPRKVCKVLMLAKYEFRCSALLSNMSLALYTKKYNVKHQKLSGEEFDYNKSRYPWTALTDREWEYCTNDVVGLSECIDVEMQVSKTNIANIPLTSTGFVRRDIKAAMRIISHNLIPSLQPSYNVYLMLRDAFRGGDVHANRYYSNQLVPDVHSYDRSSSYPDVLCNCLFPMSKFVPIEDLSDRNILRLIRSRKALLLTISITNCRLKNPRWPSPYLAKHKCEVLESVKDKKGNVTERAQFDNGRIVSAPLIRTTVTDIDYAIIHEQYEGEFVIECGYYARYGSLPSPFIDCVRMYYSRKTALKGDKEKAAFYEKVKNLLNSCYGCVAQDPVRIASLYLFGNWISADAQIPSDDTKTPDAVKEALKDLRQDAETEYAKYTYKAWGLYAWGVWCTAWARLRLYEGVKMASMELPDRWAQKDNITSDFVYCDTDSVKYVGTVDWTEYNRQRMEDSIRNNAFADDVNGTRHYMGVYEHDGDYNQFLTLGSKKYITVDTDGSIHCTISGVSKRKGPEEIKKRGGIDALLYSPGGTFTFREAGGTELKYNDEKDYGYITVDGHPLHITRNVCICESTYTLGMTQEYYLLLSMCLTDMS